MPALMGHGDSYNGHLDHTSAWSGGIACTLEPAHLWQVASSIADWVTYSQGCNKLQVRNLTEHLQPSKLLLAANKLPGFHIP